MQKNHNPYTFKFGPHPWREQLGLGRDRASWDFCHLGLGFCNIYRSKVVKYQEFHIVGPNAYLFQLHKNTMRQTFGPLFYGKQRPKEAKSFIQSHTENSSQNLNAEINQGPFSCAYHISCHLKSALFFSLFPNWAMLILACFLCSDDSSLLNSCVSSLIYSTDTNWQTTVCQVCVKAANSL